MSDNIWQSGNFGVGVNKGEINTRDLGGMITNEAQFKNLTEAAAEIQELLSQLEKSHSITTNSGKMAIATEAIKIIESNPKLHQRVFSALKAGGIQALAQFLNHPAATFVIAALEEWQKHEGE
jgi:hypothetical protein